MENQQFYRIISNTDCDEAINDRHLVINCTGVVAQDEPFMNHNKRGRNDYYLMYIYKGKLRILQEGEMQTYHAGHLVIFTPESEYCYAKQRGEQLVYYWIHFTGFSAQELLDTCGFGQTNVYEVGIDEDVVMLFKQLFRSFIRRDNYFELLGVSYLTQIVVRLRQDMDKASLNVNTQTAEKIYRSIKYIHANYTKDITVTQMAQIEHLSTGYYRDIFKSCIGVSPQSYIIHLRIRNACELLIHTQLPIKQIAAQVGYADQFYFYRLFKNCMKETPTQYRRRFNAVDI